MLPNINDLLYIQVASEEKKETDVESKSRIADIREDCYLIEVPIEVGSGRMKRLHAGDELSAYFLTEEGVKNYFSTYVLGFVDDVVHLVRIRKPDPDSITKVQRRNFLRVSAELEIAIKRNDGSRFIAHTDDVGGGGLSFICDGGNKVYEGDQLNCWLLIPYKNGSIEHAPFEAEVVRVKRMETGRKLVMLKFRNIFDMERQKIIRYCFERQFDFRNR